MLGELFSNAFKNMFDGKIYWPTLVLQLLVGIASIIALLIVLLIFGGIVSLQTIESLLMVHYTGNIQEILNIFKTLGALIPFIIIISLIAAYLKQVINVFIGEKITVKNAKKSFFGGLGQSWYKGLLLFLGIIVLSIIYGIIGLIFAIPSLIPIVGIVFTVILWILLGIYAITGFWIFMGHIITNKGFGKAFVDALSKPFTKPMLWLYTIVIVLFYLAVSTVIGIISLIPVISFLIWIFVTPLITIFAISIAIAYSQF